MSLKVFCLNCKHFQKPKKGGELFKCKAFPNGIPMELLTGEVAHTRPYSGDKGVRFEAIEIVEELSKGGLHSAAQHVHPVPGHPEMDGKPHPISQLHSEMVNMPSPAPKAAMRRRPPKTIDKHVPKVNPHVPSMLKDIEQKLADYGEEMVEVARYRRSDVNYRKAEGFDG